MKDGSLTLKLLAKSHLGTLNITGITSNMAGSYHCQADNEAGDTATLEVTVIVRYPPDIVQFGSVTVSAEGSISLPCSVNAYPYASVQWTTPSGLMIDTNR